MRALTLLVVATLACSPGDPAPAPILAWESWRPAGVIGDTLSSTDTTVGSVLETAITSRGQVLVLDGADDRLLAFDAAGRMLARAGGTGGGPGELRDPVALSVIAGDSVLVVDRTLRRVLVFTSIEEALWAVKRFDLDFGPEGACLLRGELFLIGSKGDVYLHRYDRARTTVSSLSPVAPEPALEQGDAIAAYRRFALGAGRLACDDESGLLVHAPSARREVYGIHPDGRFAWTITLDSLALRVITPGAGGVRFDIDPAFGYAESVARVTPLGGGQALLIVRRTFARDARREAEYWAIVIDIARGTVIRVLATAPHVGAVAGSWATEHLEVPTPAVRVWRRY
jgi:hypothetical protein